MTNRFRAELGVTPKTAARIFRFERACGLISVLRLPLADVAAACGYADQAHMTRDWNAFTGASPKTWIANELPFLQDYELSGRDVGGIGLERAGEPVDRLRRLPGESRLRAPTDRSMQ